MTTPRTSPPSAVLPPRPDPERIFLLDIDNTLLDNDRVLADLRDFLKQRCHPAAVEHYWATFETLRAELGRADYLGALARSRAETEGSAAEDPALLLMGSWLLDYPFSRRLYPEALAVIRHLARWGTPVILTDGDALMQSRKLLRSGLWDEVDGRVLICTHKEQQLEAIARRYPARHYVMVDDKLRLLAAMKAQWGERLTTVFVRQGHYADDPVLQRAYPAADLSLERIGALLALEASAFEAPPVPA